MANVAVFGSSHRLPSLGCALPRSIDGKTSLEPPPPSSQEDTRERLVSSSEKEEIGSPLLEERRGVPWGVSLNEDCPLRLFVRDLSSSFGLRS